MNTLLLLFGSLLTGAVILYFRLRRVRRQRESERRRRAGLLTAALALAAGTAAAQPAPEGWPDLHGTVRAKYEFQPPAGKGRFEVRNARVSLEGRVRQAVGYKAEIDLSDEGTMRMLDAYIRLQGRKPWKLTLGQMRVPFSIDAHRAPHEQWMANRSFIAKQTGDVRDVGLAAGWTAPAGFPLTLEGGLFNGSGLTGLKTFWTSGCNFSVKLQASPLSHTLLQLSAQKARNGRTTVYLFDGGAFFDDGRWHFEAEYLRKHYAGGAFRPVDAVDVLAAWRRPCRRTLTGVTFAGRYDYMSDHSRGEPGASGQLVADDPARHRLTAGATLGFGVLPLQADLRLNYEHYFYRRQAVPAPSEQSKIVAELVCRF